MKSVFRIHPAIGIARLGNADPVDNTKFFIGAETPGVSSNWDFATGKFDSFKTPDGFVKKQAARFRIWEYLEDGNGNLVPNREVNPIDTPGVKITWTVHLANRKASFYKFDGQTGADGNNTNRPLRNSKILLNRASLLEIDEQRSISVTSAGPDAQRVKFDNSNKNIPIDGLGELQADDHGRLLVFGGKGQSASNSLTPDIDRISDYANNDTWFDDVADGPVTATITLADGTVQTVDGANGAWVTVAPPNFAPSLKVVVTLYDTLWDVAVRRLNIPGNNTLYDEYLPGKGLKLLKDQNTDWQQNGTFKDYKPSFTTDIYPVFQRAFSITKVHSTTSVDPATNVTQGTYKAFHYTFSDLQWASLAALPGLPGARSQSFKWMRDPDKNTDKTDFDPKLMPRGLGDNYEEGFVSQHPDSFVSLTRTQYAWLRQWRDGNFQSDWTTVPASPTVPQITPEGLDRAALENCAGAPFFPGIESSWLVRKPAIYAEPFRIMNGATLVPDGLTVRPGFFTQQMACPWQADFYDCRKELYTDPDSGVEIFHMWWAARRPDDVYRSRGDTHMQPWVPWIDYDNDNRFVYMLNNWFKLGFVIQDGDDYFETERAQDPVLDVIPAPPPLKPA
jgi:hypothetical protein